MTLFLTLTSTGISQRFDRDFTGATMRLDFYHTGNASQEYISLDRTLIVSGATSKAARRGRVKTGQ